MLQTKFQKPFITSDIIPRPRLRKMFEGFSSSVMVCAPAGFGKSVVVSQWLERQSKKYFWLSLDQEQNNLSSFLEYFISGIESSSTYQFSESKKFINIHQGVIDRVVNEVFINELSRVKEPLIIALDDYHRITNPLIHSLIKSIIQLPSQSIQMILITRVDPPINTYELKIYRKLQEVRMNELALDHGEFLALIEHRQVPLSDKEIHQIEKWTEGWILGINIAFALGGATEATASNSPIAISHDIGRLVEKITENLAKELSELVPLFALCENFNEQLLQAIVKHLGSEWKSNSQIVETLRTHNLFLIQLEESGDWYRFHHLFRDLLMKVARKRDPMVTNDTVAFISQWFAEEGMIDEAIRYASELEQMDLVTQLVATYRFDMLDQDQWWRVQRWIDIVPEPRRKSDTDILLAQIFIYEDTWQLQLIPPLLAVVERELTKGLDNHQQAEIFYHQGHQQIFAHSNPVKAIELFEKSKELYHDQSVIAARREMFLAVSRQMVGQDKEALQILNELEDEYIPGSQMHLRAMFSKMMVILLSGNFKEGQIVASRFASFARNCGFESLEAYSCYMFANVALQQLEFSKAIAPIDRLMTVQGKINYRLQFDAMAIQAICFAMENEMSRADHLLCKMGETAKQLKDTSYTSYYISACARVSWLTQNGLSELSWAKQSNNDMHFTQLFFLVDVPALTQCRVLLTSEDKNEIQQGLIQLDEVERCLCSVNNHYHDVDIQVLRSLAAHQIGHVEEAKEKASGAIRFALQHGNWLPILELCMRVPQFYRFIKSDLPSPHVQKVFSRMINRQEKTPYVIGQMIDERISSREKEIIFAVVQGMRNKEIAESLNISEVTVKSHLTNIFKKMQVPNRTTLSRRAKELNIV